MSKSLLILLLASVVLGAQVPTNGSASVGTGDGNDGTPRIACEDAVWKFGTVPQHTVLKHEFVVSNAGEGVLKLTNVIPSCQCSAALPKKQELGPGEKTAIEVTLNTQTFQGTLTKSITVVSNDPRSPHTVLTLTGEVLPPFVLGPRELSFGKIAKHEPSQEVEFTVTITRGVALQVKEIKASNPKLKITPKGEAEELADGSRILRYGVVLEPGTPVGLVRENITVLTDLPAVPAGMIGLSGTIEGEVDVEPGTFNLGRVKQGETTEKEVEIIKAGAADLAIEGLDVSPADTFTAELITVEEGRHYKVKVALKKDAKPKYHKGTLVVRTNCPGETQLKSYFYVYVAR